jgi:hypothetical protein
MKTARPPTARCEDIWVLQCVGMFVDKNRIFVIIIQLQDARSDYYVEVVSEPTFREGLCIWQSKISLGLIAGRLI